MDSLELYTKLSAKGGEWVVVLMHLTHFLFNLLLVYTTMGGCRPYGPPSLPQLRAEFMSKTIDFKH